MHERLEVIAAAGKPCLKNQLRLPLVANEGSSGEAAHLRALGRPHRFLRCSSLLLIFIRIVSPHGLYFDDRRAVRNINAHKCARLHVSVSLCGSRARRRHRLQSNRSKKTKRRRNQNMPALDHDMVTRSHRRSVAVAAASSFWSIFCLALTILNLFTFPLLKVRQAISGACER